VQPGPGPQAGTAAGPQSQQGGAQRQQPKPADEEEDIFGDAGTDYKPSVSGKKKAPQEQQQQGGGGDDMELEEGEAPPDQPQAGAGNYGPAPPTGVYADPYAVQQHYGQYPDPYGGALPAWPEAAAAGYPPAPGYPPPPPQAEAQQQQQQQQREDVPKWRVRTRKAEERMVDYVDDAYGEFYQLAVRFCDWVLWAHAGWLSQVHAAGCSIVGSINICDTRRVATQRMFLTIATWPPGVHLPRCCASCWSLRRL
jgi:IK cytokine